MRRIRKVWLRLIVCAAATFFFGAVSDAVACQVCFSGRVVTIGQQLDAADKAVLAVPATDGGGFRVVALVKGTVAIGSRISESVSRKDVGAGGEPHLLLRNKLGERWMVAGSIGIEHAGWLRSLASTHDGEGRGSRAAWLPTPATASDLSNAEWAKRVALAAPYLESSDPMVARIAFDEISRAPYGALRTLGSKLKASEIAGWVYDPALASRRPTYLVLLGISGGSRDAAWIETAIQKKWTEGDSSDLAPMLTAALELQGPQRVEWIEERYFKDRTRSMPEIEAALLALSVHGSTSVAVPRDRVIAAYRLFMRERKAMAGYVAQELADWKYWDATSEYEALLKSDAVKDPAAHFMIVNYLQRSPQSKASLGSQATGQ